MLNSLLTCIESHFYYLLLCDLGRMTSPLCTSVSFRSTQVNQLLIWPHCVLGSRPSAGNPQRPVWLGAEHWGWLFPLLGLQLQFCCLRCLIQMGFRGRCHQVVSAQGPHARHSAPGDGSQMNVLGVWTHLAFFLPPLPSFCRIFDTVSREPSLINTSHSRLVRHPQLCGVLFWPTIFIYIFVYWPLLLGASTWCFGNDTGPSLFHQTICVNRPRWGQIAC